MSAIAAELEKLLNRRSTPQQIALRAKIILLADQGKNNREIGRELNLSRFMARRWRNRWLELSERLVPVIERLQDEQAVVRQQNLVWIKLSNCWRWPVLNQKITDDR